MATPSLLVSHIVRLPRVRRRVALVGAVAALFMTGAYGAASAGGDIAFAGLLALLVAGAFLSGLSTLWSP